MLNGQSECVVRVQAQADATELQGIHTVRFRLPSPGSTNPQAKEVHIFLKERDRLGAYPLFDKVYNICWEGQAVENFTDDL